MLRTLFASCVLLGVLEVGQTLPADDSAASPMPVTIKSPLSPEESLKHFVLGDPNLQIEIVAAEPEVIDPVAIQFDEHGRMWVVEMRDYPTGPQNAPPPLGGPDAKPLSRIKLLEDKDGDGRYETAHVFADNLLFATGIQPWDGGVIVTLAGEVAYFKDTDGDHKADFRETWFTGFAQANTQLRANHPTFGPDGWIYIANGLRGGNVIAVKKDWRLGTPARPSEESKNAGSGKSAQPPGVSHDPANPVPVSLTGRDFKFDPLTGRYEAISGNGQFGMTFDAWGNRFVCDNRHPCRQVIFEEDFIRRCPHVAFPAVVNDVIPPDDKNKVFPLTSAWTTSNLHAGTFTASCGVCVYTGDWLPEEFRGNVFVCEPTGNLVQRAVLEPDGVTFKSRNPYERSVAQSSPVAPRQDQPNASSTSPNKSTSNSPSTSNPRSADLSRSDRATETQEFLASRDDWFRPVDLQNGPDGALYVVDMYRAVIEHPEWVPDELKNRPDTWLGNDKGRIYRIRPKTDAPRSPKLHDLRTNQFAFLNDETQRASGWNSTTATRLLHERLAKSDGLEGLRNEYRKLELEKHQRGDFSGFQYSPSAMVCWKSAALSELINPYAPLVGTWADETTRVMIRRLTAMAVDQDLNRRTRDLAALSAMTLIQNNVVGCDDYEPLQFEIMKSLSFLSPPRDVFDGLNVSLKGFASKDRWQRLAVLAVELPRAPRFLDELAGSDANHYSLCASAKGGCDGEEGIEVWGGVAEMFAALGEEIGRNAVDWEVRHSIERLCALYTDGRFRVGSSRFPIVASGLIGIQKGLAKRGGSDVNFVRSIWAEQVSNSQSVIDNAINDYETIDTKVPQVSIDRRQIGIRFLAAIGNRKAEDYLKKLAEIETDQSLKLRAVEAFSSIKLSDSDQWLVAHYAAETPAIRRTILSALLASKERQLALLGAIADGKIAATEIDPVRAKQLTESKDEAVREKARQVLAAAAPASRKEVLVAYQPALTLKGDAARGREVFQKNCVTCHRIGDLGVNVAPDISDTRTKKPEQLLMDILDPNRAIDANYFAYAVVTKDGKTESGVIASESSNSITLKQPEGKVLTILRSDIDELRNTGISLMPVGVEKNINRQQMADLIFWLKNWRYLQGNVPATSLGGK